MTVENAVKNNGGKNMSYNEFLPSYSIGDLMLPDVMEKPL